MFTKFGLTNVYNLFSRFYVNTRPFKYSIYQNGLAQYSKFACVMQHHTPWQLIPTIKEKTYKYKWHNFKSSTSTVIRCGIFSAAFLIAHCSEDIDTNRM